MADLGVLLLHGYTSSLDTVNGLLPTLERMGLPYRMPVLRGHGTHPRDLRGVTARDWYGDASAALDDLLREVLLEEFARRGEVQTSRRRRDPAEEGLEKVRAFKPPVTEELGIEWAEQNRREAGGRDLR